MRVRIQVKPKELMRDGTMTAAGALAPCLLAMQALSWPRERVDQPLFYVPEARVMEAAPVEPPMLAMRINVAKRPVFQPPDRRAPSRGPAPELPEAPHVRPIAGPAASGAQLRLEEMAPPPSFAVQLVKRLRRDAQARLTIFGREIEVESGGRSERLTVTRIERTGSEIRLRGSGTASRLRLRAAEPGVATSLAEFAAAPPAGGSEASIWTVSVD